MATPPPHPEHTEREQLAGAGLVLVSGLGYAAVAILAKVAFEEGSNAPTSLFWRFGLASVVFWVVLAARRQVARIPRQRVVGFAVMGLLFSAGSVASFMAVERIPASLAALVFYIYPAIVTLGSAVFFGSRFSWPQLLVLAGATAGCALTVDLRGGDIDALGLVLALITPFFYSGYVLLGSRLLRTVPPLTASAWIITFASVLMIVLGFSGVFGDSFTTDITPRGWLAILALAFFSTVVAIWTFLAGMARLDAFRASIISTIEPVTSVVLAALVLSERLSFQQAIGGVIIVSSTVALQVIGRASRKVEGEGGDERIAIEPGS